MKINNVTGNRLKVATIRKTLLLISLVSTFGEIQAQNPVHPPPYTLAERSYLSSFNPSLTLDTAKSISPNPIGERNFSLFNTSKNLALNSTNIYCHVTAFGESNDYKFHRTSFLSEISSFKLPFYQNQGNAGANRRNLPFSQVGDVTYTKIIDNSLRAATAYCAHSPNLGVTAAHAAFGTKANMFKDKICNYIIYKNYNDNLNNTEAVSNLDIAVLYPTISSQNFVSSPHQPFSLDITNADVTSTLQSPASSAIYSIGVTGQLWHPFILYVSSRTTPNAKWSFRNCIDTSYTRQWVSNLAEVNRKITLEDLSTVPHNTVNKAPWVGSFEVKNAALGGGASGGPVIQFRTNSIVALGTQSHTVLDYGAAQPTTSIENELISTVFTSNIPDLTKMCNSAKRAMGQLKPLPAVGYPPQINRPSIDTFAPFSTSPGIFGEFAHHQVTVPIDFSHLMTYINRSQEICRNKYVFDPGEFISELRVARIVDNGTYSHANEYLTNNYMSTGHLVLKVVHKNVTYTSTGTLKIGDIWRQYPCPSGSGLYKTIGGVPLRTRGLSGSIWPDLSKLRSTTGQFFDIRGLDVNSLNTVVTLTVKLYPSSTSPPPTSSLGLSSMQYEIVPSYQ